ncbi:MAG TPA: hypothetical protein VFQ78_02605 [Candidatus Udaeobacter sp.]|jgi:hypothetical protein|nr:hypothetical protein [Candidatus Udaeobacter sp.]
MEGMFLLGVIVATASASLGVIVHALHKAPEGYEDEHGFHFLPERPRYSGASILPRRAQDSMSTAAFDLPAHAHSKS